MAKSSTRARKFGWGIVGTGTIARQFADDLAHVPDAWVAAVHSRSAGKAAAFAPTCGAAEAYDDLARLLADPAVEAVYIATPNFAHVEQALAAIEAGKPVLVEKPLATSAADARRIAVEAERKKVFAMEAMWSRFLPAVQAMKRMVDAGAIGKVRKISAELAYRKDEAAGGRFFDAKLGGGAALDLGVYPLSLAWLLLGRPQLISGNWTAAKSGVDLHSEFDLSYPGAEAKLACGFDRDGANIFLVEGERGALRLEAPFLKAQRLSVFSAQAAGRPLVGATAATGGMLGKILSRLPAPGRTVEAYAFPGNGLQFEAQAVMQAVRAGRKATDTAPLGDSVAVLETIGTVLSQPPRQGGGNPRR